MRRSYHVPMATNLPRHFWGKHKFEHAWDKFDLLYFHCFLQQSSNMKDRIEPWKKLSSIIPHLWWFWYKILNWFIHAIYLSLSRILFPVERQDLTEEMFESSGVDPTRRPTRLTMEEFNALCLSYSDICHRIPGIFHYNYRWKCRTFCHGTPGMFHYSCRWKHRTSAIGYLEYSITTTGENAGHICHGIPGMFHYNCRWKHRTSAIGYLECSIRAAGEISVKSLIIYIDICHKL